MAPNRQTSMPNANNPQQTSPSRGARQILPPNNFVAPSSLNTVRTAPASYLQVHTLTAGYIAMQPCHTSPHPQHLVPPSWDLPAATAPSMTPLPNAGSPQMFAAHASASRRDMEVQMRTLPQQQVRVMAEMERQLYLLQQQAGVNSLSAMPQIRIVPPQDQPTMQQHCQSGPSHRGQGPGDLTAMQDQSAPMGRMPPTAPSQIGCSQFPISNSRNYTAHQNVPASSNGSSLQCSSRSANGRQYYGPTTPTRNPAVPSSQQQQHPAPSTIMSSVPCKRCDTPVPTESPPKRQRVEPHQNDPRTPTCDAVVASQQPRRYPIQTPPTGNRAQTLTQALNVQTQTQQRAVRPPSLTPTPNTTNVQPQAQRQPPSQPRTNGPNPPCYPYPRHQQPQQPQQPQEPQRLQRPQQFQQAQQPQQAEQAQPKPILTEAEVSKTLTEWAWRNSCQTTNATSMSQAPAQGEQLQIGPLTNKQNADAHLAYVKGEMRKWGSAVGSNPDYTIPAPESFALEERRKWTAEIKRVEAKNSETPEVYVPAKQVLKSAKGYNPQPQKGGKQ